MYPVELSRTYILAGICGHRRTKGEVRHHGESIHTHDDNVGRNHHLAEAVGQRLNHDHSHGEDGLGDTGRKPQTQDRHDIFHIRL